MAYAWRTMAWGPWGHAWAWHVNGLKCARRPPTSPNAQFPHLSRTLSATSPTAPSPLSLSPQAVSGNTLFYVPVGANMAPYAPELCAYIPTDPQAPANPAPTPNQFASLGLALSTTATSAFLEAAIGASNST